MSAPKPRAEWMPRLLALVEQLQRSGQNPPPSRRELARALGVSPSTVHHWVWRAARAELVVQRARRARAVRASAIGAELAERRAADAAGGAPW